MNRLKSCALGAFFLCVLVAMPSTIRNVLHLNLERILYRMVQSNCGFLKKIEINGSE
jgi:hypothetical protein